jgi:hypothetical protein
MAAYSPDPRLRQGKPKGWALPETEIKVLSEPIRMALDFAEFSLPHDLQLGTCSSPMGWSAPGLLARSWKNCRSRAVVLRCARRMRRAA